VTALPPEAFVVYRDGLGNIVALNLSTNESWAYSIDLESEVILAADCSTDGSQIAYLRQSFDETDRGLIVAGADGTTEYSLPPGTQSITWSPDRTRIAFSEFRPQTGYAISTLDLATNEIVEQLRGLGVAASLRWSPDGTRLAFYAPTELVEQIWLYEVDSFAERPTVVTGGGGAFDPDWTADGQRLILSAVAEDQTFQIFELDPATGETTQITHSEDIFKRLPRLSPDGETIAYTGSIIVPQVSREASLHAFGIFLMGRDGSNERSLTVDPRLNPGEGIDPFLDAVLLGWCRPGPWLDEKWTPQEAQPTIPTQ
jgi:Tol biopolymer transport system component